MINYFMLFFAIGTLAFNIIRFKKFEERYGKIGKVICTVVLITSYILSVLAAIWYFVVIYGIYGFDNELIGKVRSIDWSDESVLNEYFFDYDEEDNSMVYIEMPGRCSLQIKVVDITDSYDFANSLDGIEYNYKLYPTWTWELIPCFINAEYQFKTDNKIILVREEYFTDTYSNVFKNTLDKMI